MSVLEYFNIWHLSYMTLNSKFLTWFKVVQEEFLDITLHDLLCRRISSGG